MAISSNNGTTAPGRICAEEYVVKKGDSFYLISHKLGVPLRDLLAANRDIHPARLMVGDVLCIPREENHIISGGETVQIEGESNENMGELSGTGGISITVEEMGGTNQMGDTGGETPLPNCPLDEQHTVQSGQTVADIQLRNLVSRNTLSTANPAVNLDQLAAGQVLCVPKENIPCAIPSTYKLTGADTLESIAIRYNLPVASLLRANPCLAPQDFECGVTIILPT